MHQRHRNKLVLVQVFGGVLEGLLYLHRRRCITGGKQAVLEEGEPVLQAAETLV